MGPRKQYKLKKNSF